MVNNKTILKQYFTPNELAKILVDNVEGLVTPENIVDLSVGTGELLFSCYQKWSGAKLFGVDIDNTVLKQANNKYPDMFILNNSDGLNIRYQSSFKSYFEVLEKGGFDLCIANPPFNRYHKINIAGKKIVIPSEILFLEKYIDICRIGGFIAIILPNGILTNHSYKDFRKWMLRKVITRKVISVPIEAFPEVNAKTEILILQRTSRYRSRIIEFKEYNNIFNLTHEFKKSVKKSQLNTRMDFDYYYSSLKEKYELNLKNISLKKLEDITYEHGRGSTVYGEKRFFVQKGVRYLHSTNIGDIGVNFEKEELFVEKDSHMYKLSAQTKANDILIVRVGNTAGKTAVVLSEKETGVASDCLYIFRLKDEVNPYFFVALLKTNYMRNKIESLKHGSCSKVISKKDLLQLEIPLVQKKLQNKFGTRMKNILINYQKQQSEKELLIEQQELVRDIENSIRGERNE